MPGLLASPGRFSRLMPVCLLPFLLIVVSSASSQWGMNPSVNTPIAIANDSQQDPVAVSDGTGGAIIAWVDFRGGSGKDIYAQRVDSSGIVQWTVNGLVISGEPGIQDALVMMPDGLGGAYLVWEDKRTDTTYDIFAQRIDRSGAALWAAGGLPICDAAGDQQVPVVISDGSGGAIVAWTDTRPERRSDIYAQRINAQGARRWAVDGVPVAGAVISNFFGPPAMAGDGDHGAILCWDDTRSIGNSTDIYAQRIDSAGASRWDTSAVALYAASATQRGSVLVSDGAGGAIACWTDFRNAPNAGIYGQHINAAGAIQWGSEGLLVNDVTDVQQDPAIVSDGAGGAVISWTDKRGGTTLDIYAQRVGSAGTLLWNPSGIPLCTAPGDQIGIRMVSDSTAGGAIAVWMDNRGASSDIFAQRISGSGTVQWATNGLRVSTATGQQISPAIALLSPRAAVVAWTDGRVIGDDVYAQNIDLTGTLGLAPRLVSPAGGASLGVDSVRFVWTRLLPRATRYWLDLATDSAFTFRLTDSTITDTTHTVKNLVAGQNYWWRVRGFDSLWGPFSAVRRFTRSTTAIRELAEEVPQGFSLGQNYPNPFNPSTTIGFTVPSAAMVTLEIFDQLGRTVATLVSENLMPGSYRTHWDARGLASGTYFCRLRGPGFLQTRPLMLLK